MSATIGVHLPHRAPQRAVSQTSSCTEHITENNDVDFV